MKQNIIPPLFKILLLYEDMTAPVPTLTVDQYVAYLQRISVMYLGMGLTDVYYAIVGLAELKNQATHEVVRSTVFHMISLVKGAK